MPDRKLVKIVTHHEFPEKAAELFAEEGVAALGWGKVGDLTGKSREEIKSIAKKKWNANEREAAKDASQLSMFRDDVKKGDIVLAYKRNNKVALVGEVVSGYIFNDRNKVGKPNGEIRYPQQVKVNWWEKPRNFHRSLLPEDLASWVAQIGTIAVRNYDIKKLKEELQKIPSEETVSIALEISNEDEIKDYIEKHLGEIEEGLVLVAREYSTTSGPMDFLAKDGRELHAVIEVKVKADDTTVTQLRRYMRSFRNDAKVGKDQKIRGLIVAQEFTKHCIDDAREMKDAGYDIQLRRCKKSFVFEELH